MDLKQLSECVSLAKDFATIVAAGTATVIGILGLQTWKKQLRGKAEYELARRLLGSVYKVREATRLVRAPFASAAEIWQSLREAEIELDMDDPQGHAKSQRALYARRWKTMQAAVAELQLDALEAEVLWGPKATHVLSRLQGHVSKLAVEIETYLRVLENATFDPEGKLLTAAERVVFIMSEDPDKDRFAAEMQDSIRLIEDYVRPHLRLGF